MEAPGNNDKNALYWVQSHEGWEDAALQYHDWYGYFVETSKGDMNDDDFMAMASYCYNLFNTPMWAREWSA